MIPLRDLRFIKLLLLGFVIIIVLIIFSKNTLVKLFVENRIFQARNVNGKQIKNVLSLQSKLKIY